LLNQRSSTKIEMLDIFIEKISRYTYCSCIEILLQGENIRYRQIELNLAKGSISIIKKSETTEDLETILPKIKKLAPLILLVNGYGILHRSLNPISLSNQEIIAQVLPNANAKDFIIQKTENGKNLLVSIIRKKIIAEQIALFKSLEQWPVAIAVGNFHTKNIISFIENTDRIATDFQLLAFNKEFGIINSFEKKQTSSDLSPLLKIGDDKIPASLMSAYAAAFCLLTGRIDDLAITKEIKEEHLWANIFNKGKLVVGGVVAILLLLNTFFFYNFKDKKANLQRTLFTYQDQFSQLDSMRNSLSKQRSFLKNTRLNGFSKSSYYADQIGHSIPKGIALEELTIFPEKKQKKPLKKDKLVDYDFQKINIKGKSDNSIRYNDWITTLKVLPWITEVTHISYQELQKEIGKFETEITIRL